MAVGDRRPAVLYSCIASFNVDIVLALVLALVLLLAVVLARVLVPLLVLAQVLVPVLLLGLIL